MRARNPCWRFRVRFERCKVRFIPKGGYIRDLTMIVNCQQRAFLE